MRKKLIQFLSAIIFLAAVINIAAAQSNDAFIIKQSQFQLPVLIQKKNNPIIRIKISVPSNSTSEKVKDMVFSTSGTSSLSDIKNARLYYTGSDSTAGKSGMLETAKLVGETNKVSRKIRLSGSQPLVQGDNYFWLSYELNDKASMLNVVDANCLAVAFSSQTINVAPEANNIKQRIGFALRKNMQDSVHTHRIPGITTTKKGTLLAIYDARRESSRDLQGNMDIGVSRSTNGGNTWEKMRVAMDMGTWGGLPEKFNGVSDANILVDEKSGTIFIAGLWMHGVLNEEGKWIENLADTSKDWNHQWRNKGSQPGFDVKQTSQFLIVKSIDDGKTWSEPVNVTRMCKKENWWLWAPAPGHGITMSDGTLVFPTQGRDDTGRPFSNITYSKDGGNTWKTSVAADTNTTENMVVQLSNGTLMLNMRANDNRFKKGADNGRSVAVTTDLGATWKVHPTSRNTLREPVCMASLHKHNYAENGQKKSVLLFVNPNSTTKRNDITIKVSFDDGMTWPEKNWTLLDVWDGKGYSCITSIDEKTIGVLYEGSMSDLIFQKYKLSELIK